MLQCTCQSANRVGCLFADYITGKLTPSVFTQDCIFTDPTTRVQGVEKYTKAVAALFDHKSSRADLISIKVAQQPLIDLDPEFPTLGS